MSLRRRLLIGCAAVAFVLLAADLALASTFKSFLLGRVDRQLAGATNRAMSGALPPGFLPPSRTVRGEGPPGPDAPPQFTEFLLGTADMNGHVLTMHRGRFGDPDSLAPEPSVQQVVDHAVLPGHSVTPFTASAPDGDEWRLAAIRVTDGIVLVGIHLGDVSATLARMQLVLVAATLAVLVTLGLVAVWVHRQGVRPLAAMTATASVIAAGDLSERVAHTDERTEAGRLGAALNTMMSRIEGAFAKRAESERRLRRFVADASHELRTPLTSIRGYAELYRRGALDDPRRLTDAMRRVEGEAARMGGLVEDMLLLARLDQGRPLERTDVALDRIAADAVADARAVDSTRLVELDAVPVTVPGDEARLRQVVANLVGNAVRHTPAGTPVRVSVTLDGTTARLEVADSGPGMDAETASRVFERFYRADPSRASSSGGAGLGLSIVDAVVAAHGGVVRVETAPGAGARFIVELPAAQAAVAVR